MRLKLPPSTCASVRTVSVLARPGTPSSSTWPLARRLTSRRSSIASWPTMTRLISYSASSSAARGSSRGWVRSSSSNSVMGSFGCFLLDQAAEPAQGHGGAEEEQDEGAAGEARRDLALLVLGAQERAQALVDVREPARVRGGVRLAARGLCHLGERARVGRDGARLRAALVA